MALIATSTITGNGDTTVGKCFNKNHSESGKYTIAIYGTFSLGTATVQASPNGGSTWITLTANGASMAYTGNVFANFELYSDPKDPILINVNLAGAGTPSLTVKLYGSN